MYIAIYKLQFVMDYYGLKSEFPDIWGKFPMSNFNKTYEKRKVQL
jgi:hypothetical protein